MADSFDEFLAARGTASPQEPDSFDTFLANRPAAPSKQKDPFDTFLEGRKEQIANPQQNDPKPATPPPENDPGFFPTMGDAAVAGGQKALAKTEALWQGLKSKFTGGDFFTPPEEETPLPPSVKEQMDRPLDATSGFDPKWWGTRLVYGGISSIPELVAGAAGTIAGTAVGGPPGGLAGGMAGFGAASTGFNLPDKFREAKAKQLSDEDAAADAIRNGLLEGGFGAVSWGAMGIPLFGTVARQQGATVVANAFKRPFLEAAAQIGLVQPAIAGTSRLAQHPDMTPGDALEGWVTDMGLGALQMGAFHGALAAFPKHRTAVPSDEYVRQVATAAGVPPEHLAQFSMDIAAANERRPVFYSAVQRFLETTDMKSASAGTWLNKIRGAMEVKAEEIDYLGIPTWLADQKGKISKEDLTAHVLENQIELQEVVAETKARWASGRNVATEVTTPLSPYYMGYVTKGPFDRYININFYWPKIPGKGEEPVYTSPHFGGVGRPPAGNLLASGRLTSRVDRDGKRILVGEELQADWLQTGRRAGFDGGPPTPIEALKKQLDDAWQHYQAAQDAAVAHTDSWLEYSRANPGWSDQTNTAWNAHDARYNELHKIAQEAYKQHEELSERYWALRSTQLGVVDRVPNAPFKDSWHELLIKRLLRYAADEGYDRIAFVSSAEQITRYPGLNEQQQKGMREFYDRIVPQTMDKWAKKLQMPKGETDLPGDAIRAGFDPTGTMVPQFRSSAGKTAVTYWDISPAAASRIRVGFAQFEHELPGRVTVTEEPKLPGVMEPPELRLAARQVPDIIRKFAKKFDVKVPIGIVIHPGIVPDYPTIQGGLFRQLKGEWLTVDDPRQADSYRIELSLAKHITPEALYTTAAHEFGHIIAHEYLKSTSPETLLKLKFAAGADESFLRKFRGQGGTAIEGMAYRDNYVKAMQEKMRREATGMKSADLPLSAVSAEQWNYWVSFDEWMAEQAAKWATTDAKPLGVVDKYFGELGKRISAVMQAFAAKMSGNPLANPLPHAVYKEWVESLAKRGEPWSVDVFDAADWKTKGQAMLDLSADGTPDTPAVPLTGTTLGGRKILGNFAQSIGPSGKAMAAAADSISKFHEWMISLPQMAKLNPGIRGLVDYHEYTRIHNQLIKNTANEWVEISGAWKRVMRTNGDALSGLMDDYQRQKYLTPAEVKNGVERMPTQAEFAKMVKDNGVGKEALAVFDKLYNQDPKIGLLRRSLERVMSHELLTAMNITDPVRAQQKVADIQAKYKDIFSKPYAPRARFGDFIVRVKDANGNVVRYEAAESAKVQKRIHDELQLTKLPGEEVIMSKQAKDVGPIAMLPGGLLDAMADKMNLSTTQRAALDDLRAQMSPSRSFAYKFQKFQRVPGWSDDFKRTFDSYFFSFSRWMANVEMSGNMKKKIEEVRESVDGAPDGNKRSQVLNYMIEHYNQLMDPKRDVAFLRGALFHMVLGFNPASATLNLTQTLMGTYPLLAEKFGDFRAIKAMVKANTDLSTFYSKARVANQSAAHLKAIDQAIHEGILEEGQAQYLGALVHYDNIAPKWGAASSQKLWETYAEWSGKLFETTEKYNRRVAWRSAWDLAMERPNAEYVRDSVAANPLQYQRLLDKHWSPTEAAAYVTALDAVESTQYVYAPYARPKFMWGKKGTLFAFKSFTQNTLFMLWNYPGARVRSLLILGALGGLAGLPGAEDITGTLKGLAWQLFGKDFDLDDQVRHFAVDVLDGKVDPETLLHGLSRHGFGIPQLFDMLGLHIGQPGTEQPDGSTKVWPGFDRSAAIGMGRVSPVDIGRALGPTKDLNSPIVSSTQQALGAGFGYGIALYKALFASQYDLNDLKRWEGVMPHWTSNASHAYRYYHDKMERNAQGNPVVRFDPTEPVHLAEIIGRSLGYQPARLTEQWDRLRAEAEAKAFWGISQQILLKQAWHARRNGDDAAWEKALHAIHRFNDQLPDPAKLYRITSDVLKESFKARATAGAKQEMGIPNQRRDIPLVQDVQKLHPGAEPVGRQTVP